MKAPLRQRLRDLIHRLEAMPMAELTRGQRFIRFFWQLWATAYHQLRRDRAGSNAAALTFRTLFSLLPILVLTVVVTRSFISEETFMKSMDEVMEWLHMDEVGMADSRRARAGDSIDLGAVGVRSSQGGHGNGPDRSYVAGHHHRHLRSSPTDRGGRYDLQLHYAIHTRMAGFAKRIWVYLGVLLLAPAMVIAAGWFLERGVQELGVDRRYLALGRADGADLHHARPGVVASATLLPRDPGKGHQEADRQHLELHLRRFSLSSGSGFLSCTSIAPSGRAHWEAALVSFRSSCSGST